MPKCEKCAYPRATSEWCTNCGSNDPYPIRKRVLRWSYAIALVLTFIFATFFSRYAALKQIAREKRNAAAFRAHREVQIMDLPPAARR